MKKLGPVTKYFQITGVIAVFAVLAYLRQVLGYNSEPAAMNQLASNTTPASIVVPTVQPVTNPTKRPVATSVPANTPVHTTPPTVTPAPTPKSSIYKDGTFTGSVADAYYGNVQVQLVVSSGKITQVNFLQHPSDNRTSQYINGQAMPMLQQEVIQAQSGNINAVSGASATSQAFYQSLTSALQQAQGV